MREIRGSDTGTVPGLSVLLAYVLMLASIVVLVLFVHHAGQGLRVAGLIGLVGERSIAQPFNDLTPTARASGPAPTSPPRPAPGGPPPGRR